MCRIVMFSYATRSRTRYSQSRPRQGYLSSPPIVGAQPRVRGTRSVGGRRSSRVSPLIRQHYKLGTVQPVFCNRSRSFNVSAADGEQALVTFVPNKIRTIIHVNRAAIAAGLTNEVELDTKTRTTAGTIRSNFNIQDSLPGYSQGSSTTGTNWSVPATSWILGDNWMFRDMLMFLARHYSHNTVRHGYMPPCCNTLAANSTYGNFPVGTIGILSAPVHGTVVNGDPDSTVAGTSQSRIGDNILSLNSASATGDQAGYGELGIGAQSKHLFVHSMSIDFTVTNLEENPIDVVFYELILKNDVEFQFDGEATGNTGTTTYAPTNCGLPDPVEIWQTMANRKRGSHKPLHALSSAWNPEEVDAHEYNPGQKTNTYSVYEPNMDPLNHLDRYYNVKRRSARIEPGGKYKFQYVLKMNRTCPPWWLDKLYGMKGFTRQYMLRVKGVPGMARTSTSEGAGLSMGTTSQDANIRVDVNKSWRASLLPRKQKSSFIERIPRIATAPIAVTLGVNAEGEVDLNDIPFGGNSGTTQKLSFAENTGQLL